MSLIWANTRVMEWVQVWFSSLSPVTQLHRAAGQLPHSGALSPLPTLRRRRTGLRVQAFSINCSSSTLGFHHSGWGAWRTLFWWGCEIIAGKWVLLKEEGKVTWTPVNKQGGCSGLGRFLVHFCAVSVNQVRAPISSEFSVKPREANKILPAVGSESLK